MSLENHLKDLIVQTGPINMAEFMQIVLSHPDYGYYKTKEPFGVAGDFTTSPEISQMFGELIGIWCADILQQMDCAGGVELVEIGPGRGTLMDDLLRITKNVPGFHDNISVSMVETSKRLAAIQREKISARHPRIKWVENVAELPEKPLIIIANELFDALPIHQYIKQDGKWHEKMLGVNGAGELEFVIAGSERNAEGGTPDNIADGGIVETCPSGEAIMQELCGRIKKNGGAVLIIDYGYFAREYKDTLFAISNHKHQGLLENIGKADLSAHVDFTTLGKVAKSAGMNIYKATQCDFLRNMGIGIRAERLSKNAIAQQKQDVQSAMERLTNDAQMGKLFKVLAVCDNKIIPAGF